MQNLVPRLALFLTAATAALAVETNPAPTRATADYVPNVAALAAPSSGGVRELVERFVTDRKELERFYSVKGSALQTRRLREFFQNWQERLAQVDFEKLGVD